MALLPITLYGDKILRKKAAEIKQVDNETIELITNMFETMRNAGGIGLAANQVGANKSLFVVDISNVEGYENSKPMVLINPKIIKYSEEKSMIQEGCLSIPELKADVERSESITISYLDADLKEHQFNAGKLLARVMQHELDHLNGVLFIDLISDEEKKKMKKPLSKISKRNIEVDYPVSESKDYQLVL